MSLTWHFPIKNFSHCIPRNSEPGAFGVSRKYDVHTGVDLYCPEGTEVFPCERGVITKIEYFTGEKAGSPWWEETMAVFVLGKSGLIVYGEISPKVTVGQQVFTNTLLGNVLKVLKKDKGKPTSMLHLEYYAKEVAETVVWNLGSKTPEHLLDPSPGLAVALVDLLLEKHPFFKKELIMTPLLDPESEFNIGDTAIALKNMHNFLFGHKYRVIDIMYDTAIIGSRKGKRRMASRGEFRKLTNSEKFILGEE